MRKAKEDARRLMEQTRRESEAILSYLKRLKKAASAPDAETNAIRKRLEQNMDSLSEGLAQKVDNGMAPKTVKPGDQVEILTLGNQGTVLSEPDAKGEVQLQAGIMKFKAHLSQLRLIKPKAAPKEQASVRMHTEAMTRTVRMECDVRGMNLEEAIAAVDQYLDEAILAGLGEVQIIHGKGTGILRSGIQQHLKRHMHVGSFRRGVYGEGEDGVTVVTLK